MHTYTLYQGEKKTVITASFWEQYPKMFSWSFMRNTSLSKAMSALSPFVTAYMPKNPKKSKESSVMIGDISIILGLTTPTVFDSSPYFVEYDNLIRPNGVPCTSCLVRERDNPEHVVADLVFSDDSLHKGELTEEILRELPIASVVPLDEQIRLD